MRFCATCRPCSRPGPAPAPSAAPTSTLTSERQPNEVLLGGAFKVLPSRTVDRLGGAHGQVHLVIAIVDFDDAGDVRLGLSAVAFAVGDQHGVEEYLFVIRSDAQGGRAGGVSRAEVALRQG